MWTLHKWRAAFPYGIDEVHEFSFHCTQRTEVMLAFPHLLFVIALQARIAPACDEGGIEKHMAEVALPRFEMYPLPCTEVPL